MLTLSLRGIGLLGPGLADWAAAREVLLRRAPWHAAPTVLAAPSLLPSAERRRAGAIVKLSLAVASQAVAQAAADPRKMATVFTSSSGDGVNCHALCEALATPERAVSPTRFTNSVHNAAAGYWHIATASRAASTSLCAFDASFGAGLLEAASQCASTHAPVLLVAADVPYPQPMHEKRPLPEAFGVALLFDAPGAVGALAQLRLDTTVAAPTRCDDAALEALRGAVPAARVLPLLLALAALAAPAPGVESDAAPAGAADTAREAGAASEAREASEAGEAGAEATAAEVVLDYLDDLRLRVRLQAAAGEA